MGVFFITWQLWEEMTFVLACAIVVVFLIGLYKLWRTSRQVRRLEVIDEEKRARLAEMRRVHLSSTATSSRTRARKQRNNSDIPFGVRAIQTGVEVDGIWISRPTTPSQSSYKSKKLPSEGGSTTATTASIKNLAGGKRLLGDYQPYASSPLGHSNEVAGASSGVLTHDVHDSNDTDAGGGALFDTHSNMSTPLPQISEYATFASSSKTIANKHNNDCGGSTLNEDALKRLEGTYSPTGFGAPGGGGGSNATLRPPFLNTYIPTSRMSSPSPSVNQQHPHYDMLVQGNRTGPGAFKNLSGQPARRSNSSSSHSSTSSRQPPPLQNQPATTASPAYTSYRGYQTQPVPSPASHHYAAPAQSSSSSPPKVVAAFAGSAIASRTSRRVNPSFEVLPAGTFAAEGRATRKENETLRMTSGPNKNSEASAGSNGSNADGEADAPSRATAATPSKPAPPTRNKLRRSNGPLR